MTPLKYLYDNGYYYGWTVRGYDGIEYGQWALQNTFNLSALVSMNLINKDIDFGFKNISYKLVYEDDTTDDSPNPIVVENEGNSLMNVSLVSSNLFLTRLGGSDSYRFKLDNLIGYLEAFNFSESITNWFNVPITKEEVALVDLNWGENNRARVDFSIKVPTDEPEGGRSANISFTARLSE